jgi:hypothetical protein
MTEKCVTSSINMDARPQEAASPPVLMSQSFLRSKS